MGILPGTTAHFMRNKNLDNIQTDASRIVTGTTKFIPVQTLYDEIKWGTLESHIQLWLRLTGELSFLIGEKIDRGLASLRSPIRF